jgi:hypothetical protein
VATVPSGLRAAAIPGASGGGALRQAIGDDAPLGSSDGDSPEASGKRRQCTVGLVATMVARGAVGFGSDGGNHGRRGSLRWSQKARSSPAMAATQGVGGSDYFDDHLLRSGGLGGVLQRRHPPINCLYMWLLVKPRLRFFLIMMYDVDIYATFYIMIYALHNISHPTFVCMFWERKCHSKFV